MQTNLGTEWSSARQQVNSVYSIRDRIGPVVWNNLCLLINSSKLVRPNATDARKLVKRVTLVISVTPSQNNNGIPPTLSITTYPPKP